jgi:hypothetical protein
MNIYIALLIALSSSVVYGAPIYKTDLRIMHETEKFKLIANTLRLQYALIYNNIVKAANEGKHEYQFDIMCRHQTIIGIGCVDFMNNPLVLRNNGGMVNDPSDREIVKISFAISRKIFTQHLLRKLNATFPDSTLTRLNKPCCDYKIAW